MQSVEATQAKMNLMLAIGYLDEIQKRRIADACEFSDLAHTGQTRKSGEPYVLHPLAVAHILSELQMDADTIIAGLLHDVVEDTHFTEADLTQRFGEKVAELVDGVTKLKSSHDKRSDKIASLRKILMATLKEPRVIVIKLADRLHNMSTLEALKPEKRERISRETLDIFIPMARLVGMGHFADKLEQICFTHLEPELTPVIKNMLSKHRDSRHLHANEWRTGIANIASKHHKAVHIQAIDNEHEMMQRFFKHQEDVASILNSYAIEVIAETVVDCHELADALADAFICFHHEDAIKHPLPGGKQHLKLTLKDTDSTVNVTILTEKMQHAANVGMLVLGETAPETSRSIIRASLANLESFLNQDDAKDTVQGIISHLHRKKVLVYTPKGQVHELPKGSNAIDFAYAVSNSLGNHAVHALINGKACALETIVSNGQVIEIVTQPHSRPNPEWLSTIATAKARHAIQKALAALSLPEQYKAGEDALKRALTTQGIDDSVLREQDWQAIMQWLGLFSRTDIFSAIATGNVRPQLVAARFISQLNQVEQTIELSHLVQGTHGIEFRFAGCCTPILGDPILGHLTHRGIVAHRIRCSNMLHVSQQHPTHVLPLEWQTDIQDDPRFSVSLFIGREIDELETTEIIAYLQDAKAAFERIEKKDRQTTILFLIVRDRNHLAKIIKELRLFLNFPKITRNYAGA